MFWVCFLLFLYSSPTVFLLLYFVKFLDNSTHLYYLLLILWKLPTLSETFELLNIRNIVISNRPSLQNMIFLVFVWQLALACSFLRETDFSNRRDPTHLKPLASVDCVTAFNWVEHLFPVIRPVFSCGEMAVATDDWAELSFEVHIGTSEVSYGKCVY